MELHYGGQMQKSQTTRGWAIEVRLSFREAEQRLDAKLFLNEYLRWEIEAPIGLLSSTKCFYMPLSEGGRRQRGSSEEATGAAYQGLTERWAHLPWNSWDTGLLTRKSGTFITVSTCWKGCLVHHLEGPQQRREAIQDILSSLRGQLHWQVYPVTTEKDTWGGCYWILV